MIQHSAPSLEKWRAFEPERQLLMVANEMNRVSSSLDPEYERSRRLGYQRVLALTDLTIEATERRSLRRELLRWRDLVAWLYSTDADPAAHARTFRALLSLSRAGRTQLKAMGIDAATHEAPDNVDP